jgi:hypothetical protein
VVSEDQAPWSSTTKKLGLFGRVALTTHVVADWHAIAPGAVKDNLPGKATAEEAHVPAW